MVVVVWEEEEKEEEKEEPGYGIKKQNLTQGVRKKLSIPL